MARIRKVEIEHFRGINDLKWCPSPGINCLIGPGDSGKSTVLDAIDLCLGARKNIQISDADFHGLKVDEPICITVTLGDLDDSLKRLETYGMCLRGYDSGTGDILEEPRAGAETVLSVKLTIANDLEPTWSLVSERSAVEGHARSLNWSDRLRLAPTRIGELASYHLGWRRGSVLNRVSDERTDMSAALAKAARDARHAFADEMGTQLGETLSVVAATAKELGILMTENVRAMLDADSIALSGGAITLHSEAGVPISRLGTGSVRLLIAGLQRKASTQCPMILIDELEYGLEPHRIVRFLDSLGAKEERPPLQVFATTHSPSAVRVLSGRQLFIIRQDGDKHIVMNVGADNNTQAAVRLYPEALPANAVIACEGASEIGLIRGLDHYRAPRGAVALAARGVALVDCNGGGPDRLYRRAEVFQNLGYRVAVLRDDDIEPGQTVVEQFDAKGGATFTWRKGMTLEDELFLSLTPNGVCKLLDCAVKLKGEATVDAHIKTVSRNASDLNSIRSEASANVASIPTRQLLGKASRTKDNSWYKNVTDMQDLARDVVGPDMANAEEELRTRVASLFSWIDNV